MPRRMFKDRSRLNFAAARIEETKIRPKLPRNIIESVLFIPNLNAVYLNSRFMVARHIFKLISINAFLLWATVAAADVRLGTYLL